MCSSCRASAMLVTLCRYSDVSCRYSDVSCRYSDVSCRYSVVSCRYSDVSCRYSVVSCRYSDVSCRYSVVSCRYCVVSCQRGVDGSSCVSDGDRQRADAGGSGETQPAASGRTDSRQGGAAENRYVYRLVEPSGRAVW